MRTMRAVLVAAVSMLVVADAINDSVHFFDQHARRLQEHRSALAVPCPDIYPFTYYEASIELTPGDDGGKCSRPQQVFLGHDLNLLFLKHGLGEAKDQDNVQVMGGVCPFPDNLNNGNQANLRRLRFGFRYRGGFACGFFCGRDDSDARKLQADGTLFEEGTPEWFENYYVPQWTATVEADIRRVIFDKHQECLGSTPLILVSFDPVGIDPINLDMKCAGGDAIEFLDTINLDEFYVQSDNYVKCDDCSTLQFSDDSYGEVLYNGMYVPQDAWQSAYGVTIEARASFGGGYTPGNSPRILDSGFAASVVVDMLSPNEDCPSGGPGKGAGGMKGAKGENCDALGNLLVIQGHNDTDVVPNIDGGTISFTFEKPVLFSDIGIVDADETEHRIVFHLADGSSSTHTYEGFGDNGVQRVICNMRHVIKVDVVFKGTAAISEINYCSHCETVSHESGENSQLISLEDFEGSTPLAGWYNSMIHGSIANKFTHFMGHFTGLDAALYKQYSIPSRAESVDITLRFYHIGPEFDNYDDDDDGPGAAELTVYIGDSPVSFGAMGMTPFYASSSGTTPAGITYTADNYLISPNEDDDEFFDRFWNIKMTVPKSTGLYNDGYLLLKLDLNYPADAGNIDDDTEELEAGGYDDIRIRANYECHREESISEERFEYFGNDDSDDEALLTGWVGGKIDDKEFAFSQFLGRYKYEKDDGATTVSKAFIIPDPSANLISISVDFYQLDGWSVDDKLTLAVDNETIPIGYLERRQMGGRFGATTSLGLDWQCHNYARGYIGFKKKYVDKKYQIMIDVPKSSGLYEDGLIELSLLAELTEGDNSHKAAGYDNVVIKAVYACNQATV